MVKYLEEVPTKEELKEIIKLLGIAPIDLVRKKESIWREKYKDKKMTPAKVIAALVKYPILIERPIVIKNGKAAIGRPVEKVLEIL